MLGLMSGIAIATDVLNTTVSRLSFDVGSVGTLWAIAMRVGLSEYWTL